MASLEGRAREAAARASRARSASRRREVSALTDKAARLERLLETLSRQSEGEEPVGPVGRHPALEGRPRLARARDDHRDVRPPPPPEVRHLDGLQRRRASRCPLGTPVRAVYAGKAVYAQWLAEYGNLVILDHGDGMLTLYAWLQAVSVKPGEPVAGGRRGRAWRATGRDGTSRGSISKCATARRRAIRWRG